MKRNNGRVHLSHSVNAVCCGNARMPFNYFAQILLLAVTILLHSSLSAFAQVGIGEDPAEILRKLPRNLVVLAPAYPPTARENGISGEVILEFGLTDDGHARDIRIVKAQPTGVFEKAVLDVLPNWLFLPDWKNACDLPLVRSHQHVFFEVKEGKTLFSFDPLVDAPLAKDMQRYGDDNSSTQPVSGELKAPMVASSKLPRLRFKEQPVIEYPIEAKKADAQAYIYSIFDVTTDGNIENIEFPFVIVKEVAKNRVLASIRRALKIATMETVDGKPPPKRTVVCLPFSFQLH